MNLKVLLPFKVFTQKNDILRIVAMTDQGSFGLLPNRLDCVASLSPGILFFESISEGEVYIAADEGVLVKTGVNVLISVHNAVGGMSLDKLHEAVEKEFLDTDAQERKVRSVLTKMESGFIRRLAQFQHE
jgi:F-type H+-transporting ATPase subunit epsilon